MTVLLALTLELTIMRLSFPVQRNRRSGRVFIRVVMNFKTLKRRRPLTLFQTVKVVRLVEDSVLLSQWLRNPIRQTTRRFTYVRRLFVTVLLKKLGVMILRVILILLKLTLVIRGLNQRLRVKVVLLKLRVVRVTPRESSVSV